MQPQNDDAHTEQENSMEGEIEMTEAEESTEGNHEEANEVESEDRVESTVSGPYILPGATN